MNEKSLRIFVIMLIVIFSCSAKAQLRVFSEGQQIKKEDFDHNINYLNSLLTARGKAIQLNVLSNLQANGLNNNKQLLSEDPNLVLSDLSVGNLISHTSVNEYFSALESSILDHFSYRSCDIPSNNATGKQFYSGSSWGTCVFESCNQQFQNVGGVCYSYSTCQDLYDNGFTSSGDYTIDPDVQGANAPLAVYCDMTNSNGKINVIKKSNYGNPNISYLYNNLTDRKKVHFYAQNGTNVKYSKLEQLPEYSTQTIDMVTNDATNVVFHFVKFSGSPQNLQNGLMVNGTFNNFINCDTNQSSYIYFNQNKATVNVTPVDYPIGNNLVNYGVLSPISSSSLIGGGLTVAFGGCGVYYNDVNMSERTGYSGFLFGI